MQNELYHLTEFIPSVFVVLTGLEHRHSEEDVNCRFRSVGCDVEVSENSNELAL